MSRSNTGFEVIDTLPTPSRPTRVDWALVARLLGEGRSTAEVARLVGCSRQHVWSIVRRSKALHWAIADSQDKVGIDANLRLEGLRPAVAQALAREVEQGNTRVLLWLASRLGLGLQSNARLLQMRDDEDPLDSETLREWDDAAEGEGTAH